jgi:hypothetical protein
MARTPPKYRLGEHPKSLANLRPPQKPGDPPLNPTRKNGAHHPYSDALRNLSTEVLPEHVREALNLRIRRELHKTLRIQRAMIPDLYRPQITWAEASAVRQSLSAVLYGNIAAATEVREATEGRAVARIEFANQEDKLEELLESFKKAAAGAPMPEEEPPKIN